MLISSTAGRGWFFVFLGVMTVAVVIVQTWWLPRKGINGWPAEPREKYYALRGWKVPPDMPREG
jgi:predicted MFS family arabinose efflux permease